MYGVDRNGVGRPIATDKMGVLLTRSVLMDAAMDGRLFSAASQDNVTTTVAMSTTWTGLGIYNPAASGKDLVFHEFGWHQEIVMLTAAGGFGLFAATSTDAAVGVAVQGAKYGQVGSVAIAEEACTIADPILVRSGLGSHMTGGINTIPSVGMNIVNIDGAIVIPPGYGLFSYTFVVATLNILFHFVWEEIDV
ncbi:unnamed protein product [marine sediment metagenome]|uniref:Uncharacterized protein n=1 Tax=marine sediment metagenome TaxID=412755 RepID=X0TJ49_9ZZZZ